ncbi:MAG TPA: metal-dependent hydrolase [Candidatus Ozemobacteraceae bacterium]|nr:metal-dependent hydrolase [Candidatus Ozemobacteraceae bacterium]HQG27399.1 metal-dependent hydrolase [Candidatus Ozemobacteraceae bacterium]
MNIVTHGLLSWCIAQRVCGTKRDAALAASAGLLPDLDGAGALIDMVRGGEAVYYSAFHHILGHNVLAGILTASALGACGDRRLRVTATSAGLFILHVIGDVVGSRGPDGEAWAIPWLYPFDGASVLLWSGQWEVNAWPNIIITIILLFLFFRQTRDMGWSPLRYVSERADEAFVSTLRSRFPPSARTP